MLFLTINITFACECISSASFLDAAQSVELIVVAKVNKHTKFSKEPSYIYNDQKFPIEMELEIIDKIKGEEEKKYISVRGDRGADCLRYIMDFPVKTEWVFALVRDKNSYAIVSCGDYALKVKNKMVYGSISQKDKAKKRSIRRLKKEIRNNL